MAILIIYNEIYLALFSRLTLSRSNSISRVDFSVLYIASWASNFMVGVISCLYAFCIDNLNGFKGGFLSSTLLVSQ